MKLTAALLVIASTTTNCDLGNLESAEVSIVAFESHQTCEGLAASIDTNIGVRAVCVPDKERTDQ